MDYKPTILDNLLHSIVRLDSMDSVTNLTIAIKALKAVKKFKKSVGCKE